MKLDSKTGPHSSDEFFRPKADCLPCLLPLILGVGTWVWLVTRWFFPSMAEDRVPFKVS
jgi:hypothetical protein